MDEVDRAKTLYFGYQGNHFQMARDGVLEEYRAFAVPKAQERAWMRTIRLDILQRMAAAAEESAFEDCLAEYEGTHFADADPNSLLDLLRTLQTRSRSQDTLTLFRIGQTVSRIASLLGTAGGDACALGKQFAKSVYEAALASPLSLSEYHLEVLRSLRIPPDKLVTWVEDALAECSRERQ